MKPILITQGDTARPFRAELTLSGTVPSQAVPTVVEFHLEMGLGTGSGVAVDRTATLVSADATKWTVEYYPIPDDVAIPGDYQAQWRLTFANGKIQSFPDGEYVPIKIIRKIGT